MNVPQLRLLPHAGKERRFCHQKDTWTSFVSLVLNAMALPASPFPLCDETTEHTSAKIWSTLVITSFRWSLLKQTFWMEGQEQICLSSGNSQWFMIGSWGVHQASSGFLPILDRTTFRNPQIHSFPSWPPLCSQNPILNFDSLKSNTQGQREWFSKYIVYFLKFICDNYFHWFFFSINVINSRVCVFNVL